MEYSFVNCFFVGLGTSLAMLFLSRWIRPSRKKWMKYVMPNAWHLYEPDVLHRAQMAFKDLHFGQLYRPLLPWTISTFVMALFVLADQSKTSIDLGLFFTFAILLGSGAAFVSVWWIFFKKHLHLYRFVQMKEAARLLAKYGDKDAALAFFDEAAASSSVESRTAALQGYQVLGRRACLPRIEKLCEDEDAALAEDAKEAYQTLLWVHSQGKPQSTADMEKLLERIDYVKRKLAQNSEYILRVDYENKYREAHKKVTEIIISQYHLVCEYPHLYCIHCLAKTERFAFENYEWVRCHRCQDVQGLIPEVRHAIGQVGGVKDWDLQDGLLKASLWDAEKGLARGGEVERIEIMAGQPFDYDWAVSAVVEKMQHFHPQADYRLPVHFIGDVPLQMNTKHLLAFLEQDLEDSEPKPADLQP